MEYACDKCELVVEVQCLKCRTPKCLRCGGVMRKHDLLASLKARSRILGVENGVKRHGI